MTSFIEHPLSSGAPPRFADTWGEDRFGPFIGLVISDVEYRFRWIPPGSFTMGAGPGEPKGYVDETAHPVTLTKGLWLGETQVTQALWQAVMRETPSRFVSPQRPVEQVTWKQCDEMMKALTRQRPDWPVRFPTEAEWEHACRAGTETATYDGPLEIAGPFSASVLDEIAWYGGNSFEGFELENGYAVTNITWSDEATNAARPKDPAGTRTVATKRPNDWGLYDMLGNVWEWCSDWMAEYPRESITDPEGPKTGAKRVLRGGSWNSPARNLRAAQRDADEPDNGNLVIGLRLARGHE